MLRFGSFFSLVLGAFWLTTAVAFAQQGDLARRFNELYDKARFEEALAEARKLESPVRTRSGAQSAGYAWVLALQGRAHWALGRHREAEELYKRALPILEKAPGASRAEYATMLGELGAVYDSQGRHGEAERELKRALALAEAAVGTQHPDVARRYVDLAQVYAKQGRYVEAEEHFKRALGILEKAPGTNDRLVAQALSRLADMYSTAGRAVDAEPHLKRALLIQEKALGPEHPNVADTVNTLAVLYQNLGRHADAEPLLKRAIAGWEKSLGPSHPQVAFGLNNLANTYIRLGRPTEAEPLVKRALAIREGAFGRDHSLVATSLLSLAVIYRDIGRPGEGEPLLQRALPIWEKNVAPDHPAIIRTLQALANTYVAMNRPADAVPRYTRVLSIREKALGSTHPDVAATHDGLARANLSANRVAEAVKSSRSAVRVAIGTMTKEFGSSLATEVSVFRKYFDQNLAILHRAADARALGGDVTTEAFEVAQWINQSTAATALAQMAARFGAGGDALATTVRRQQDAVSERRSLDRSLLGELAKASNQRDPKREEAMREKMRQLDGLIQQLNARIAADFPQYADLLSPKPLKPADVQSMIGANEAMLLFHVSELGNYVWAITRERAVWREIKLKQAELDGAVQKLRAAIDLDKIKSDSALFDVGAAHTLYREVLGPVEDVVAGKSHLIVVPAGALTSLPYHLLVTDTPPTLKKLDDYRSVPWLVRKHAVTVLPSVASLKILRDVAGRAVAPQAYLGFGDPVFARGKPAEPPRFLMAGDGTTPRGARVDLDRLSRALPPLPDTAEELRSVARILGAPASQVRLGQDANERAVRAAKLDVYRILHFATHALVAGETAQFTEQNEPALALTLPPTPSEQDDGLLTSSEVAALKLNAEWVILSACNTAEGDKPGAEALSGLARAFFYAGAKTLMVSHWPVPSAAAVALTTRTIQALDKDRSLTPAEALRRSMVALLDDTSNVRNAYPENWAPFVIVGTGGRLGN